MSRVKKAFIKKFRLVFSKKQPIERIIGKHLVSSSKLHHQELLDRYDEYGRDGYDWTKSRYFIGSVFLGDDAEFMFPSLPAGLQEKPVWWMMPWAFHPKRTRVAEESVRAAKAHSRIHEFFDLYESIKKDGYSDALGGTITGYTLEHPEYGVVFNQIDGHHRLAILNHLRANGALGLDEVATFSLGRVSRDRLAMSPFFNDGIRKGYFTRSDAFLLFDHCFHQLGCHEKN